MLTVAKIYTFLKMLHTYVAFVQLGVVFRLC